MPSSGSARLGTSPRQHHTWFRLERKGFQLFIFWASLLLLEPNFGLGSEREDQGGGRQREAGLGNIELESVPEVGERKVLCGFE